LFDIIQNLSLARCLYVVTDLNIADLLKNGPKPVSELAEITKTHEQSLYRVMRALASRGIFKENRDETFQLTAISKKLKEGKGSWKYFVLQHLGNNNWELLKELDYSVKTGKNSAEKVLGMSVFEYLDKNPDRNEIFNRSMSSSSDIASAAIISAYNFSGFKNIIDIGGGQGYLLSAILSKNTLAQGIVFDLPNAVSGTMENFEKFDVVDRAQAKPGDFFAEVPKGGDVYILKSILHDWEDNDCVRILKNIHSAINENGKLLVVEFIIENNNKPSISKMSDIQMLVSTKGGRERTVQEFKEIFTEAGFNIRRVINTVAPFCIIEGMKA